jgi:hypothetical protein
MKAAKTGVSDGAFHPFSIKIDVESFDDLYNLWHRFDISYGDIIEVSKENLGQYVSSVVSFGREVDMKPIRRILDDEVNKY